MDTSLAFLANSRFKTDGEGRARRHYDKYVASDAGGACAIDLMMR